MATFHSDPMLKARLMEIADGLAASITDKSGEREKLNWSSRQWCPAPYVCQKGPACDHHYYADEIGVSVSLAYAERAIFLNLSTAQARGWWKRFFKAIPVGVELDEASVISRLSVEILNKLLVYTQDAEQYGAVKTIIDLFEMRCVDQELWDKAAARATAAHHKSPYDNRRMEAEEARRHAGCMACYAASYFARSVKDPRYISEAISWSGWPMRYFTYAQHMASCSDPRKKVPVDDRGMVNVGTALFASGQWMRISEKGDELGEVERHSHYFWVSQKLIEALDEANPNWSFFRGGVTRGLRRLIAS